MLKAKKNIRMFSNIDEKDDVNSENRKTKGLRGREKGWCVSIIVSTTMFHKE